MSKLKTQLNIVGDHLARQTEESRRQARASLAELYDGIEWIEKGLAEWRALAQHHGRRAQADGAALRIAIGHLQAVLNTARSHAEQQAADTAARDWLVSIGSEPGQVGHHPGGAGSLGSGLFQFGGGGSGGSNPT